MKRIIFFSILALLVFNLQAQNSYYLTDTTSYVNVEVVDGGALMNAKFCQVKINGEVVLFTPGEVREYAAKPIPGDDELQSVFLERLVNGKMVLYYHRDKGEINFFVEKEGNLLRIPQKPAFRDSLQNWVTDCSNVDDAVKLVQYNKRSLAELVKRYNDCRLKPFPHMTYGLVAGYEMIKFSGASFGRNDYFAELDFKYDGGFFIGLFYDTPILVSNYSFHAEVCYSQHKFSLNKSFNDVDIDFIADISTFKFPILVRYTYPSVKKLSPFMNVGGLLGYHVKNTSTLYEARRIGNVIEINNVNHKPLLHKKQIGIVIGSGLEYKLDYKKSLFFELRFNKFLEEKAPAYLSGSEFVFLTSISF